MEKIGDILVLHAMEGQDLQRSHVCASLQQHEMINRQKRRESGSEKQAEQWARKESVTRGQEGG